MANQFNTFFINIGKKLAESLPLTDESAYEKYLLTKTNTQFKFSVVTEENIDKIIRNLKLHTSTGIDKISSAFIKSFSYILSKPLTYLINLSLTNGVFPDSLKIAKVLPIFKGNNLDINSLNNYRPISVLPILSKIFERAVYNQIYDYFTSNNLLYISQYGFRRNHSTELAVTEFVDNVFKFLDNGINPIAIFMDLSKAFDTINHPTILYKLRHYGISDNELNWFQSYLSNRKQLVCLDDYTSSLSTITTGVPQGSILGPLLFLIYVNDLSSSSTNTKCIMYADDTSLLIPYKLNSCCTIATQTDFINNELKYVYDWLCANKLSLNTNKTKYMIFHFTQRKLSNNDIPSIKIHEKQIERVETFKFLGN